MEPALAALKESPKHPRAIIALGFGQRTDHSPFILSTLAEEDSEVYTDVVNACLWALTMLPQVSSEAVAVLARRLLRPEERWLVVPLLVREGSAQAAQVLLEFLRGQVGAPLAPSDPDSIADAAIAAARFLLRNPVTHDEAATLCRQRVLRDAEPDFVAQRLIQATLGDEAEDEEEALPILLSDERTQSFLARNAFQDGGGIHYVGERARAIRGLAAFAPSDAYDAALRVLKTPHANDRDQSPRLLLEFDRTRAVGDLLEHLATERKTLLRRTCARALCAAGAADELRERHLASPNPPRREAACFALGFVAPPDGVVSAVRACLDDEDVRVFEAACKVPIERASTRPHKRGQPGGHLPARGPPLGRQWISEMSRGLTTRRLPTQPCGPGPEDRA